MSRFLIDGPEEAIQVSSAFAGPIHLLLTGVRMPGMSGAELSVLNFEQTIDVRLPALPFRFGWRAFRRKNEQRSGLLRAGWRRTRLDRGAQDETQQTEESERTTMPRSLPSIDRRNPSMPFSKRLPLCARSTHVIAEHPSGRSYFQQRANKSMACFLNANQDLRVHARWSRPGHVRPGGSLGLLGWIPGYE